MNGHWSGPAWGEPSAAADEVPPLRPLVTAPTAGYRAEGGRSEAFLVLAASVGGISHRLAKRRCEDCFGWAVPALGRLGLVVADGVGSAGRGGEGAEMAVDAACRSLLVGPGGWGRAECLGSIEAAHEELERAGGGAARELATTIVVALLEATGSTARATLGRVGDSSAFSLSDDGSWRELFAPPGEQGPTLLDGATAVLPLGGAPKRVKGGARAVSNGSPSSPAPDALPADDLALAEPDDVQVVSTELGPGGALALVTDGVAEPLRDGPTTVAPQLARVLLGAPRGELSPLGLAMAADFSRRGAHDDRTLLVAWLLAAGEPLPG
jgi:serine/threonine protein phosphatase PrpC